MVEDAPRTSLMIIRATLIVSILINGLALWVNRSRAFTDFGVLHFGSGLYNDGRADAAYNPDVFLPLAAEQPILGEKLGELDVFWSTPPFAFAMRPLSSLSHDVALVLWLVIGVAALLGAVRLLRLPLWSAAVAIAMPFGLANIHHAQTGFLAILWAAAIHRLATEDRVIAAGAIAGLAVLKPTLLLGVALWWLLDWRKWYPALAAAFGVGVLLIVPTVVGGFDRWRAFIAAFDARAANDWEVFHNQPTIGELVIRLFGYDVGSHPLATLAYIAIGAVMMRAALTRFGARTDVVSACAVIVSILISPHMVVYDTGLVLIPIAVAVHHGVSAATIERLAAVFAVTSLMSIMSSEPFGTINQYVIPATIGLGVCSLVWLRAIASPPPDNLLDDAPVADDTLRFDAAA